MQEWVLHQVVHLYIQDCHTPKREILSVYDRKVSVILLPSLDAFLMLGLELQLDLPEFLWHLSPTQLFLNHQYCSGVLWAQPFLLVLVVILFLSQPLCFEPGLALLKLLLNPIALVAKICCWKIWFLQSSRLWYFFHDKFTCICEAHRSFHKPTDWYLATIWASSPILSRIYLFFPPNLSWTWAWVFHKENCCIEQSCKARRRATMINCMVPLGERFGLFKGK